MSDCDSLPDPNSLTPQFELEVQRQVEGPDLPQDAQFHRWVGEALTLAGHTQPAELLIRVVDESEATALNQEFAGKNYTPNVLSFPFEAFPGCELTLPLLGDIVICAAVVQREAREQSKEIEAHWAHMVIHGVLHLLGLTHDSDERALEMENLETLIMTRLGYPAPYE